MTHYFLSADPTRGPISAGALQARARHYDYWLVNADTDRWTLIDAKTGLALSGAENADFIVVARLVANLKPKRKRRSRRAPEVATLFDLAA
jgi:hypothetical protein